MKIVCQSCSATYKIADDKVQGKKVFKIKCKRCGEDILVRGADAANGAAGYQPPPDERPADDEATRVVSEAGGGTPEGVWHVVVNGDQQGPFSIDQLRDMLAQGTIDAESYVWRDGFDGWQPLHSVGELAAVFEAPGGDAGVSSTVAMAAPEMPPASGGDLFGSAAPAPSPAPAAGGGLFAAASAGPSLEKSEGAKARTSAKGGGGDLFAAEARQQEAAKPLFSGADEDATQLSTGGGGGGGGAGGVTGQRNENSVLFSLATLQQLSGGGAPATPTASGAPTSPDSSGLIDINKLAGALHTPSTKPKTNVDDILSVGTAGGLASPLAAPVLAPVPVPAAPAPVAPIEPARPQGANKTVIFAAAAVALIVTGGVIASVAILNKNNADQGAGQAAVAMNTATAPTAPAAPTAAPAAPAAPTQEAVAPAAPAAAPTEPAANGAQPAAEGRDRESSRARTRSHASRSPEGSTARTADPAPTPAAPSRPAAPAAAPSGGSRARTNCAANDLNCLMSQVGRGAPAPSAPSGSGSGNTGGSTGGGGGDLPDTPSRSAVMSAMRSVQGAVAACGTGTPGTAFINVTFANTGRVTTANVEAPYAGTTAGSCMARAVRGAEVPPFRRATQSVRFPFNIR